MFNMILNARYYYYTLLKRVKRGNYYLNNLRIREK